MMKKISRREALTGVIATGVSGLGLISAANADAEDRQTEAALAFAGKHQPKPLPFDPTKLNGISEKLIRSHHENNYTGAVKALNLVEQRLSALAKEKDLPPYIYGDLKRQELIRTGSVVLHEKYFDNLGGNGKADGSARKLIEKWFGGYETWEAEFKRTGNSLSGGSGWTILGFNLHTKELHNYGAAAAKYIDAFMANANWEEVNRRVEGLGLK